MRYFRQTQYLCALTLLGLLSAGCPGVFTNVDLERHFNKGYGYSVFQHGQSSPTGAPLGSKFMVPWHFEIDSKGRYVAVVRERNASGMYEALYVRFLPNGVVDTTFGVGGAAAPNANLPSLAGGIAATLKEETALPTLSFDSSNRIYVTFLSGTDGGNDKSSVVMRLLEDGSIDTSFASAGYFLHKPYMAVGFAGGAVETIGLRYDASTNALTGIGFSTNTSTTNPEIFTAQYDLTGALVPSFGASGGYSIFQHDGNGVCGDANANKTDDTYGQQVVDAAGNRYAVVTGGDTGGGGSNWTVSVAKVNTAGNFDPTFGAYGNGIAEIPNKGLDGISGQLFASKQDRMGYGGHVELDSSGRLLMAGTSETLTGTHEAFLLMWSSTGILNSAFGTGGVLKFNAGGLPVSGVGDLTNKDEGFYDAIFDENLQRIVAVGHSDDGSLTKSFAARFLLDGTLDTSFGTNGIKLLAPPDRPTESFAGGTGVMALDLCMQIKQDSKGRYVILCTSATDLGDTETIFLRLNPSDGSFNK